MPYLEPAVVLREFSRYALSDVRPALADDEEFIRGQVGSMASTLRFLAAELDGFEEAVEGQRDALDAALSEAATRVSDEEVAAELVEARDQVASAGGNPTSIEATLLTAADEALAAVQMLPADEAQEARDPLYEFLDARLAAQHRLLGRRDNDG